MDTKTQSPELHVTRSESSGRWTVAADLEPLHVADEDVTVEIVGDEAIVAVDAPGRRTEFDVELPGAHAEQSLRNGVLVIEGPAEN